MPGIVTRHAATRMQQRAISMAAINLLVDYGTSTRSHGADRLFFDQATRQRARDALGKAEARRCARFFNTYAVVADDGAVITVAWRTRRLRRT